LGQCIVPEVSYIRKVPLSVFYWQVELATHWEFLQRLLCLFWEWTIYSQWPICQTSQLCLQSSFVGPKCNRSDMLATISGIPRTFIS